MRSSAWLQVLPHRSLLHCSSRGAQLQRLPHAAAEWLPPHHVLAGPLCVGHALPHCGDSPGDGSLWSLREPHCSCAVCCSIWSALWHALTWPEPPCTYLVCYVCHLLPQFPLQASCSHSVWTRCVQLTPQAPVCKHQPVSRHPASCVLPTPHMLGAC